MNFKIVLKNLGIVLICEALLMGISLLVAIIYEGSDIAAFIYTILITLAAGIIFTFIKPDDNKIYAKEGLAIVALAWFLISLFGSLPFYFSGTIPNFFDCLFETISGFTTTGATVLPEVESLPKGILFWRSFTHWVGGLGVLVFYLAVLPKAGATTFQIMKAESPGPVTEKLVPKIGQTAKILYLLYFVMTIILVIFLMFGGMSLYDSLIHAFGTAGTGGFSNKNISVGYYHSTYLNIVISIGMLVFGANFALYYQMLKGNLKSMLKDDEFRFYMIVVATATLLITFNIYGSYFQSFWESLMHAFFQVSSIITTTGYATADFNTWPYFSKMILVLLMFFGGCAGSTAGAIKQIRILLLLKTIKREIVKGLHPRAVTSVKVGGKIVQEGVLSSVAIFFFTYMCIFAITVLAVSFEGHDFETSISAVATCIGNVGPGLGAVGPMSNFSVMSDATTLLLSINMLLGRLEIFPVLIMFTPAFWKRGNI